VRPNGVTAQASAGDFAVMSTRQMRQKTGQETDNTGQFGVDRDRLAAAESGSV
jgi:hypothetical protein